MKRTIFLACLGLLLGAGQIAKAAGAYWPTDAKVYFVEPKDGATISGPVKVVMGVKGIEIAPAGTGKPAASRWWVGCAMIERWPPGSCSRTTSHPCVQGRFACKALGATDFIATSLYQG